MELVARQTGRAHEHESRRAFACSGRQRRHATHSEQALSASSRPDYQKSDGECHADFRVLLWAVNATVPAKQSSDAISLRQLPLSTADGLYDFADCINHQSRLFL